MKNLWGSGGSVEEKGPSMKSALCEASQCLGGDRRWPDWFQECSLVLKPLLQEKSRLYTKFLSSQAECDREKFKRPRSNTSTLACTPTNLSFPLQLILSHLFESKAMWLIIQSNYVQKHE